MDIIRVETPINNNIQGTWEMFTDPKHIVKWNYASDDWECPYAKNDLKVKGRFVYRMTAKDKSASFNFSGTYKEIKPLKLISYVLDDTRKVTVTFEKIGEKVTKVIEIFEPEKVNPIPMQRAGWQAILDNFKKYVEANPTASHYDARDEKWIG